MKFTSIVSAVTLLYVSLSVTALPAGVLEERAGEEDIGCDGVSVPAKRDLMDLESRALKPGAQKVIDYINANPGRFQAKPMVWYSGQTGKTHSRKGAAALEAKFGGQTAGKFVSTVPGVDSRAEKWDKQDWAQVCLVMAQHTKGKTYASLGTVLKGDATWTKTELPALMGNEAVPEIDVFECPDAKFVKFEDLKPKGDIKGRSRSPTPGRAGSKSPTRAGSPTGKKK